MTFFERNFEILKSRFPDLATRIAPSLSDRLGIASAGDGGICYAVKNEVGNWIPLSNPVNPAECAEKALNKMKTRLLNGLSPAVVVGLYPGYELDFIFNHFKSRLKFNEPFRHIYVIADSILCLAAWLKAADRTEILQRPEVLFYWHENVGDIVTLCESDYQHSHLFIPVSALPEPEMNRIIEPLAKLYIKRQKEEAILAKENNDYYDSLTDEKLASVLSCRCVRKPRLLMPAHMSSTVVQYSTRDTCTAFEKHGWETKILKMERDISPWLMMKTINEFKPDLFIFINHLRTEDGKDSMMYPDNMVFLTWIQDSVLLLNNRTTADIWNKTACAMNPHTGKMRHRDFLVGYTDIIRPFGYAEELMKQIPMIVNPEIFHPRKLTEEQMEKYGCDICFASNKGRTTEEVVENELFPHLAAFGFSRQTADEIHDMLWKTYRKGQTITSYHQLTELLCTEIPSFRETYDQIQNKDIASNIIEKIFWALNDHIYRHIVLEWCDELGLKLNLYGKDWERHPRFKKYAKGVIKHGDELSIAYQAAKYCLHLNAIEGTHQRIIETVSAGGRLLARKNDGDSQLPFTAEHYSNVLRYVQHDDIQLGKNEKSLLFRLIIDIIQAEPTLPDDEHFKSRLAGKLSPAVFNKLCYSFIVENSFTTKTGLSRIFNRKDVKENPQVDLNDALQEIVVRTICDWLMSFVGSADCRMPAEIEKMAESACCTFKLPPDSSVEDIFTRLKAYSPGIAVDFLHTCGKDQVFRYRMLERMTESEIADSPDKKKLLVESAKCGLSPFGSGMAGIISGTKRLYEQDACLNSVFPEIAIECFVPTRRWVTARMLMEEEMKSGRINGRYLRYLAEAYMETEEFQRGIELLRDSCGREDTCGDSYSYLAFKCLFRKMFAEAETLLKLELEPGGAPGPYYFTTRCILDMFAGNYEGIKDCIGKNKSNVTFLLNCLFALHTQGAAEFDIGRTDFLLDMGRNDSGIGYDYFISELKKYILLKKYDRITSVLDNASGLFPDRKEFLIAFICFQAVVDGEFDEDEAQKYYRMLLSCLKEYPTPETALLISFLCMRNGDTALACKFLDKEKAERKFLTNNNEIMIAGLLGCVSGDRAKADKYLNFAIPRLASYPYYENLIKSERNRMPPSELCRLPDFGILWEEYAD